MHCSTSKTIVCKPATSSACNSSCVSKACHHHSSNAMLPSPHLAPLPFWRLPRLLAVELSTSCAAGVLVPLPGSSQLPLPALDLHRKSPTSLRAVAPPRWRFPLGCTAAPRQNKKDTAQRRCDRNGLVSTTSFHDNPALHAKQWQMHQTFGFHWAVHKPELNLHDIMQRGSP